LESVNILETNIAIVYFSGEPTEIFV